MNRNKKYKMVCICLLILAIFAAAGITYYYYNWSSEPEVLRGGVLVHERYTVYSDRQKC